MLSSFALLLASTAPQAAPLAAPQPQVPADAQAGAAQDALIALSVGSGSELARTGTFNVNRLQQLQPALQFYSSNPRNSAINIRGLGAPFGLTNDGIAPGVGYYLDGVYVGRAGGGVLAVQRALRPPQH